MAKTKRSFIQKLIGKDIEGTEEQQVNYGTDFDPSQQNQGYDNLLEQREASLAGAGESSPSVAVSTGPAPAPSMASQGQPSVNTGQGAAKGDGDWAADQEGQLTIDVYQTDTEIVIKSTIAGVKPEDLDVQINNDMVTIKGERKHDEEVRDEDYYYQECYWGAFSRSIILPVDVQANKSEATMKNGILTIKLPKADSAQSRKIQVRGY